MEKHTFLVNLSSAVVCLLLASCSSSTPEPAQKNKPVAPAGITTKAKSDSKAPPAGSGATEPPGGTAGMADEDEAQLLDPACSFTAQAQGSDSATAPAPAPGPDQPPAEG